MLPDKKQSQLASYYEAEIMRRGNQKPEPGYSGIGFWWYGYPVQVSSTTGYGALSNASTAAGQTASGGNIVDAATDVAGDGAQSLG
jgi:hypothetical protein